MLRYLTSEVCINTSGSTSILGPAGWQLPAMWYFCSLSPCFGVLWVLLVPPCAAWERWWNSQHAPSPAGLQWWRGKIRVCFQCAASVSVQQVQRGTWTEICIMLAVLFSWWKGSIPGGVEHRDLGVGLGCDGTSVLHSSHLMLEQTSTRMEGFHHSSC